MGGTVQFHQVKLALLRNNLIDVRFELWVCLEHFGADRTLDGRFDLGLCAHGQTVDVSNRGRGGVNHPGPYSFLNML